MKEKNINIDINIENNLMSKNKIPTKENDSNMPSKNVSAQNKYVYNPELPREVNEYYGLMASKRFYQNTASERPLNINQYIGQRNTRPTVEIDDEHTQNQDEDNIDDTIPEQSIELNDDNPVFANIENIMGYDILTTEQEIEYNQLLKSNVKSNRRRMIRDIRDLDKPLRLKKSSIKQWKLARYILKHRPDDWQKILDDDYIY